MLADVDAELFEFHPLGRAARRDGRVAGAIVTGAADSSADDTVAGVAVAAVAAVLPVEGSTHVPPGEDDEHVPG